MADRRAELADLTERFVDAFNQMDLDAVVSFFPRTRSTRTLEAQVILDRTQFGPRLPRC